MSVLSMTEAKELSDMTKLYLIIGFLGAGKTTFLHKFVRLFPNQKIALIINEFGKNGVDGALLQDLEIALTEIDNGSIFCACKLEQFEDALQSILEQRPDLIFVEASGLSDPTAVKSILGREVYKELEYAGAICLVDGVRFHKVYQTARVCRMQLAVSDMVLINKADKATREQMDEITSIVKAQKPNRPVHETEFGHFQREWLDELERPVLSADHEIHTKDITLQKLTLKLSGFDEKQLVSFLKMFAEDTYRIKGFVSLDGTIYLVSCVGPIVELKQFQGSVPELNKLAVLYGNGLPARKSIKEAVGWFPDCIVEFE